MDSDGARYGCPYLVYNISIRMRVSGMIGIKMGVQTSEHNRRPADGNTNEVEPCKYNRS